MWILNALMGCSHRKTTFPLTPRPKLGAGSTYVVCLDCGAEFEYDWQNMRIRKPLQKLLPKKVEEAQVPRLLNARSVME